MRGLSQQLQIGGPLSDGRRGGRLVFWQSPTKQPEIVSIACWLDWGSAAANTRVAAFPSKVKCRLIAGRLDTTPDPIFDRWAPFPANGYAWTGLAESAQLDLRIEDETLNILTGQVWSVNAAIGLGTTYPPRTRSTINDAFLVGTQIMRVPYLASRWRATQTVGVPAAVSGHGNLIAEQIFTAVAVSALGAWQPVHASLVYITQDAASVAAGVQVTLEFE